MSEDPAESAAQPPDLDEGEEPTAPTEVATAQADTPPAPPLEIATAAGTIKIPGEHVRRLALAAALVGVFCGPILAVAWGAHQMVDIPALPEDWWWGGFAVLGVGVLAGAFLACVLVKALSKLEELKGAP